MKKLEMNQLETIQGGSLIGFIKDVSCFAAGFWPIGTAIGGPTCLGLIIATNM